MSIDLVKKIREFTGLSIGEISKALKEADGDETKTLSLLKKRGAVIAEKKSQRATGEGVVEFYVHTNKKVGAAVVLRCETDFVARQEDFQKLAHNLAMQITSMDPKNADELLGQSFIRDSSLTIKDLVEQSVAKLGENIQIGEFYRFQV